MASVFHFLVVVFQLLCLTMCDPLDHSAPGFPVLHYLLEFTQTQTQVHWVGDESSHPLSPHPPPVQSFPASGSFPMSSLFTSGVQSIGASASASVILMNIQGWFPLGLTGLILLYKSLLQHHNSKASILQSSAFLCKVFDAFWAFFYLIKDLNF